MRLGLSRGFLRHPLGVRRVSRYPHRESTASAQDILAGRLRCRVRLRREPPSRPPTGEARFNEAANAAGQRRAYMRAFFLLLVARLRGCSTP